MRDFFLTAHPEGEVGIGKKKDRGKQLGKNRDLLGSLGSEAVFPFVWAFLFPLSEFRSNIFKVYAIVYLMPF